MKYLLDTCVISELVSKRPNLNIITWLDALDPVDVCLSVITIGEIIKGIEKLPDSQKKDELRDWLRNDLLVRFQDKIIPLDSNVLVEWGVLAARLEKAGTPMPAMDALIAATVINYHMILVTRNVEDFKTVGIEIVNPWIRDASG